jgi:hypothetical protein
MQLLKEMEFVEQVIIITIKIGVKIIDIPVFNTRAPFPCENNDAEPFSKTFYEIG